LKIRNEFRIYKVIFDRNSRTTPRTATGLPVGVVEKLAIFPEFGADRGWRIVAVVFNRQALFPSSPPYQNYCCLKIGIGDNGIPQEMTEK
jgi:hypothetical protein